MFCVHFFFFGTPSRARSATLDYLIDISETKHSAGDIGNHCIAEKQAVLSTDSGKH